MGSKVSQSRPRKCAREGTGGSTQAPPRSWTPEGVIGAWRSQHGAGDRRFRIPPQLHARELCKNWLHLAVLIQMFGSISALPTMPPRRFETWNFAWREGSAGTPAKPLKCGSSGDRGAAAPLRWGGRARNGFERWLSRKASGPARARSEDGKSRRLQNTGVPWHEPMTNLPQMH